MSNMKKIFVAFLIFFSISIQCSALEQYAILAPKSGIKTDAPTILLSDSFSPQSMNVWVHNERIDRATMRLLEFDEILPDDPLRLDYFKEKDLTAKLMVCTKRDIAYRDTNNDRWVYLTPQYKTSDTFTQGTAKFTDGNTTVQGADTPAWNVNLAQYDFITTGTNTASSDLTWYEIASVEDADTLELLSAATVTTGTTAYTARTVFGGADTDLWDSATVSYEDIWVATNGVDYPVSWNGSDATTTDVTSSFKASYCIYHKGYLMWGKLVDYPQRIQWAEHNDFDDYTNGDTGVADIEGGDYISGFSEWRDFIVLFKEESIHLLWLVATDLVFNRDIRVRGIGCYANQSIISQQNKIYFWSNDNRFRVFNGLNANEEISVPIDDIVSAIPPNYEDDIYGIYCEALNQFWWAIPSGPASTYNDLVLTFDRNTQSWGKLDLEATCFGTYITESDLTWDTLPWAEWDEWTGRWDDRTFDSSAPIDLIGNRDNYVYRAHAAEQDNTSDYTGYFELNQNAFGYPNERKRLLRYRTYFHKEAGEDISLAIRKDDKTNLETTVVKNLDDETDRDIQMIEVICDHSGKYFGLYGEADNPFRFVGVIYEFERIGTR